jgi:hypothetical protein
MHMHTLRGISWLALGALLLLPPAQQIARPQDKGKGADVEVRVVKYSGLAEEIHRHLGKVIVVDFWADY